MLLEHTVRGIFIDIGVMSLVEIATTGTIKKNDDHRKTMNTIRGTNNDSVRFNYKNLIGKDGVHYPIRII